MPAGCAITSTALSRQHRMQRLPLSPTRQSRPQMEHYAQCERISITADRALISTTLVLFITPKSVSTATRTKQRATTASTSTTSMALPNTTTCARKTPIVTLPAPSKQEYPTTSAFTSPTRATARLHGCSTALQCRYIPPPRQQFYSFLSTYGNDTIPHFSDGSIFPTVQVPDL